MDQLLFTPAALLDLLSQVDELKDVNVGVTETIDGKLQIQVGESTYIVDGENATQVEVDDSTFELVDEANIEGYNNVDGVDVEDYGDTEPVTSGIIKELAKSLLLGGMIRLSAKLLK